MVFGPRWTATNRENRCPHDGRIFKQGRRENAVFWCYLCGKRWGNRVLRQLLIRTGQTVPELDESTPTGYTREERTTEGIR